MHHAILKSRHSKTSWFRLRWEQHEYACREPNGSLKPVPPGFTRLQLYCSHCKAEKCLFDNGQHSQPDDAPPLPIFEDGRKIAQARARAQGLAANGKPLIANCWNCQELRCKFGGYVCRFEPEANPVTTSTMMHRKMADMGCNQFGLRREMEIPPLDGDGADCDPL